jgi:predicted ATPase/DNA-binding SARP family transcriptional activator
LIGAEVGSERGAIQLRLLGPVQAVANGEALPLGGPRQRALLALLTLERGRPISTGRLADELWLGEPPPGAETTLRSYVSRLRRALGGDAIAARGGGYALELKDCVDAEQFERLLREGREAASRGAEGLAADRLHAALALWRGRALADVCDGGMLAAEARRLDALYLVCLEERIDADLALGRHAAVLPELRALVQREPSRERLWCQLVLALYRAGRQADALAAYREARTFLDAELGLEPSGELKTLERAILRHEVADVTPLEARHNLPAATTSFVGREDELGELESLLREHRLVTITGMGGSGKTRLVLETAARQVTAWADGVWLVDLTALSDPGLVFGAVAAALGVAESGDQREALLAHAKHLELLLVLDNCEHLVTACAELVDAVLRACPNVRVLATSRVPLGLAGELDYALPPLDAPVEGASGVELERSPAVRLFLERAFAVRRDLPVDEHTLMTIGVICRELDGLPLALELAAARAKALSLIDIAARLDDRFRFLRAWQRVADPRHQTLETTMDWSYGLLGAEEQALLRQLSVFAGTAALDAVEAVCLDGVDVAESLAALVDASLVVAEATEPRRYRLLETVRQYAAVKLADDPGSEQVRRRHAEYFLAVAEASNLSIDALGHGPQRHDLVLPEQHNLRAALDWAANADVALGLRIMLALENFWIAQALAEGRQRYEELLPRADDVDVLLRARATRDYASCLDVLRDFDAAEPVYERSRALFAEAGDDVGVAYLDYRLGLVALHRDDNRELPRVLWERSLEIFRREGDVIGELQMVGDLGMLDLRFGDYERGRGRVAASIEMARDVGWHWWEAQKHLRLGEAALDRGFPEEAEEQARRALPLAVRMANRQFVLHALAILARTAWARGDEARSAALWASVEAVEDAPGRFGQFDRDHYAACVAHSPTSSPLALDEAVELALLG